MPEDAVLKVARPDWVTENWMRLTDGVAQRLEVDEPVVVEAGGEYIHLGKATDIRRCDCREGGVFVRTAVTFGVPNNEGFLHLRL